MKVLVPGPTRENNAETRTSDAYPSGGTVLPANDPNRPPTSADKTVTATEDTDYTFSSSDFPFTDTDGDSLSSVKIVTLPATGKGTLKLNTTPVTANQSVTAANLGTLKYTPPANAHGTSFASFTFKVNDGTDESVAVNTLTVDVTAVNDPATGKPEIAGTAQVGQTLTATMGTIADVEGLGTFTYQWIRVSSGIDNIISGATASTYTLLPADEGKTIKVRFSFTDGENNAETRTSDAYPSGGTVLPANTAPTSADKTVTATEDTDYTFSSAAFPFTDTDGDSLSSVKIVTLPATGKGTLKLNTTPVTANQSVTAANLGTLKYSPPANAHGTSFASFTFKVNDGTDDSVAVNTLTVDVTAVNDPATGKPEIGGTAQVGQTLTATMGTIADVEGLGTFTYQWIQVSSGTDNIISGATASTYTLLPADEGKTIKVRFSFTDGENNAETRTSDTYPSVGAVLPANTAPTSADKTVTATEDTDYTFSSADFPFTDTDGDTLSSVKIVTLPASGTLKLNTTPVTANQSVTAANLGTLKYSPPANAHGTDFASFTFKVNDGTDDSVAVNTLTIDVTAVNDPATGKPEIGGTAQVGQTLTATMGTIADVEGLGTFTYQWIRVSSGTDNIISGATASTYTLLPADEGKTIKVRFSFTDGENNAETRTSDAYPSVGAVLPANNPPTSADKTVTATEDTDYTFSSADFVFTDTDGDSLSSVKIVTLPAIGQGHAQAHHDSRDGEPVGARGEPRHPEILPAGERARDQLCEFHLQGERRHGRQCGSEHADHRRDGGERPGDGQAGDCGYGAGGPDADRDDGHHRGSGRVAGPLLFARLDHRPVDPGGQRRQFEPDRHFGRDGQHLLAGRRRFGQDDQGEGLVRR